MSHRIALPVLLAAGIVSSALGCSGSISSPSSVTSLPPSVPVAENATQFCSDAVNYLVGLAPSLGGLVCAEAVQSQVSVSPGGPVTTGGGDCSTDYNSCLAEVASVLADASAGELQSDTGMILGDCVTSIGNCKGATVGQVAQCIADYGSSIVSLSNSLTETSVCSGKPFQYPTTPPSCNALPSSCGFGGSSSVSVGTFDGGM
jgi:hypothetical protein